MWFYFNDHLKGTSNFHREQRTAFLTVLFLYFLSCLSTGHIFRMFIHLIRARKILLIGKLKGYSILAIAEELPDDGKIFACAEVPYLGVNSQEAFDYSSDGKKISMRVGPIADTLEVKSVGRGNLGALVQSRLRRFGLGQSVLFPAHKILSGDPNSLTNM